MEEDLSESETNRYGIETNWLAQNEIVSFLHRLKPWLKQISLGGRTVCVVCPIVFSVY